MQQYITSLKDLTIELKQITKASFKFDILNDKLFQIDEYSAEIDNIQKIEKCLKIIYWIHNSVNLANKRNKLIPRPGQISIKNVKNDDDKYVRSFSYQLTHDSSQDEASQRDHPPFRLSEENKNTFTQKLDTILQDFVVFESIKDDEDAQDSLQNVVNNIKSII